MFWGYFSETPGHMKSLVSSGKKIVRLPMKQLIVHIRFLSSMAGFFCQLITGSSLKPIQDDAHVHRTR